MQCVKQESDQLAYRLVINFLKKDTSKEHESPLQNLRLIFPDQTSKELSCSKQYRAPNVHARQAGFYSISRAAGVKITINDLDSSPLVLASKCKSKSLGYFGCYRAWETKDQALLKWRRRHLRPQSCSMQMIRRGWVINLQRM